MSVKLFSKVGAALPRALELPSESRVQAPTSPTPSPAASTPSPAIPGSADVFEQVSKAQQQWEAKFADVVQAIVPELEELAPLETKSLKDLANSVNETRNVVADDQLEKGKWGSSTPVLQQTEDANCGAATVAMLTKAKGGKEAVSDAQLMDELDSRFATKEGTTPKQLSDMLAHEGMAVKRGDSKLDKGALDGALKNGGKAVAMVDSNEISTKGNAKEAGKAHWVVIDGMDDKGRYMVKDPGNGSSYFVKPEELNKAMDSGRSQHQAGGMLIVENAQDTAPESVLAQESGKNVEALGTTPGGGSKSSRFGRESS
ncbi:cysteine peptidase family C39 domain-containing protein [Archangium lansingense]|uniref:cysteine peptidase family C39 domain-containing protein n=1 Tax=Archangium lansingense TaxID=2995310 RepID=UPI003B80B9D8